MIRTNIRIYSDQKNDTNEYTNIFVSKKGYEYDTNEYSWQKIFEYIRISEYLSHYDSKQTVHNCQRDQPEVFRVDWNFRKDVFRRLAMAMTSYVDNILAKLTVFILFNIMLSQTAAKRNCIDRCTLYIVQKQKLGMELPWTQFPAPLIFVIVKIKIVKMEE